LKKLLVIGGLAFLTANGLGLALLLGIGPQPVPVSTPPWAAPAGPSPAAGAVRGLQVPASGFQAGFSVLLYSAQPRLPADAGQLLDRLVGLNVNSLSIVFPVYTDGVRSTAVHRGGDTPPDEVLASLIRMARARGFNVMLRPILDEADLLPAWRGEIEPRDPTAWFASYDALILSLARLAQREGVNSLVIGTELTSMEPYGDSWRSLIADVRHVYSGSVSYAFNWGTSFETGFWSDLDFVSVDAYFPLDQAPAGATAAPMAADWQRWLAVIEQANAPFHKSIVFTEVGVVPKTGAHLRPWDSSIRRAPNLDEQQAYYAATCDAVPPAVDGMYWWATGPSLPHGLTPDDYSPLARPAEDVVRSCYAALAGRGLASLGLLAR
jgi:hypothetical protein